MSKKFWSTVTTAAALTTACSAAGDPAANPTTSTSVEASAELRGSPVLGLEFWQDGEPSPMSLRPEDGRDIVRTEISSAPFEVRFPRRKSDVAVRMCAWTDQTIFMLEPGQQEAEVPYFRPGTGYADERSGRMTLFVGKDGHNHLVQERVASHSAEQEQILFASISGEDGSYTGDVYVTVFIDVNENETVDAGEYEYLHVQAGT